MEFYGPSSIKGVTHSIQYTNNVESVLGDMNLKLDALDDPEFNVVSYINEMFPSEQSLANTDEVIKDIEGKITELDDETREILKERCEIEEKGQETIKEAMDMIQTLFARIRSVQERATKSEEMVQDITQDIQQLDQAKRNLTVSITALNNLILIVQSLDRLNSLLGIPNAYDSSSAKCDAKDHNSSHNPFSDDENDECLKNDCGTAANFSHDFVNEISNLLAQVQRLIEPMLVAYGSVQSVAGLSEELDRIHSILATRLLKELKFLLGATRTVNENASLIQTACELVDIIPENLKTRCKLLDWFIERHLAEYKELFEPTQTTAWLDKIDQRFNWLRTSMARLERLFKAVFPAEWSVNELFAIKFCHQTRKDLELVMQRRNSELTHNLIIFALQRTLAFEANLNKTFTGELFKELLDHTKLNSNKSLSNNPFDEDGGEEHDEKTQEDPSLVVDYDKHGSYIDVDAKKRPFDGIISNCFGPYFDLYLTHVEKALKDQLTTRLIADFTVNKSSLTNEHLGDVFKDVGNANEMSVAKPNASDAAENTLYSATDLFLLFKQIIKQTLQLNRGRGLLGLVRLLRQYLSEYTVRVLLAQTPGLSASSGASVGTNNLSASDVTAKMAAFGLSSLSALGLGRGQFGMTSVRPQNKINTIQDNSSTSTNQLFSNLLRDDNQNIRLTNDEVYKVCVILVTATFCLKTVEDLEKRLKIEVRPISWSNKISFTSELDALAACRSFCVHRLVTDLEAAVEPQLVTMTRIPWNNLLQVGDQSAYITAIVGHLRNQIPLIRHTLFTVKPAFTQICIKFADALIIRFVNSIYRCKPVNTFGAEQLLLDTQSLKVALFQMPLLGSKVNQNAPRSYINLVHEGMGRAERIIKAVMLPVGNIPFGGQDTVDQRAGFVMGTVDRAAANVFLTSYEQLFPDSTQADLQEVLEMKGVKPSEQQLIMDVFHNRPDPVTTGTNQSNSVITNPSVEKSNSDPALDSSLSSKDNDPSRQQSKQSNAVTGGRIGRFDKLLPKRK